jgi:hypothetical protein
LRKNYGAVSLSTANRFSNFPGQRFFFSGQQAKQSGAQKVARFIRQPKHLQLFGQKKLQKLLDFMPHPPTRFRPNADSYAFLKDFC